MQEPCMSDATQFGQIAKSLPSLRLCMQNYEWTVAMYILRLTRAQQRLAEVQSRLDENLDAWASAHTGARFVAEPCAGSGL